MLTTVMAEVVLSTLTARRWILLNIKQRLCVLQGFALFVHQLPKFSGYILKVAEYSDTLY